jgi:hypothetical protein
LFGGMIGDADEDVCDTSCISRTMAVRSGSGSWLLIPSGCARS